MIHQAFPDLHAEVHDVIADGDLVAARVTYTGTHQGEFVGIPATGRKTTTNGVHFFRMQDGQQVTAAACPGTGHYPLSIRRDQLTAVPRSCSSGDRPRQAGAAQLCALLRAPIGVPVSDRPYTCGRCSIRSVSRDQHVRCMATAVREGSNSP
jgi:hypothetical protein